MEKIDVVFCVVTYKNHTDLEEFIDSVRGNAEITFSYKIVVVNNYADNSSLQAIKEIAYNNNCIFIENENKGYSHGNNRGISFARQNFIYDFLVVCNPDTLIKRIDYKFLKMCENSILAPEIICLNGKRQNPMYFSSMPISEKLVYFGFKKNNNYSLYLGILLNKLSRSFNKAVMSLFNQTQKKIYACHGSFIIFSKIAIEALYPVFDENIFLFSEESDLAKKAKLKNVSIIFNKNIVVEHKEDGSMYFIKNKINDFQKKSFLYYYEKWEN